jgi:hypothetical protein
LLTALGWNKDASLEQLLRVFARFPPDLLALFEWLIRPVLNVEVAGHGDFTNVGEGKARVTWSISTSYATV